MSHGPNRNKGTRRRLPGHEGMKVTTDCIAQKRGWCSSSTGQDIILSPKKRQYNRHKQLLLASAPYNSERRVRATDTDTSTRTRHEQKREHLTLPQESIHELGEAKTSRQWCIDAGMFEQWSLRATIIVYTYVYKATNVCVTYTKLLHARSTGARR